jgi:hypothetical protein
MKPKKIECHAGTIHVYSPFLWHQDAKIIGTRPALEALRDALNHALANQGDAYIETFTNDGEGFDLIVKMVNEAEAENLAMPYTDPECFPRKSVA